jgi:hypothetical protein
VLSSEVLQKIESGEIKSRRQLYPLIGGRSKAKIAWLNEHGLLVPNKWDKSSVEGYLRNYVAEKGELPSSQEMRFTNGIVVAVRRYWRTWNTCLRELFGDVVQERYSYLSDEELLDVVRGFVKKYSRLPLRSEFDGVDYPYWEALTNRVGVRKWGEVLALAGVDKIKHFPTVKHGTGRLHVYDGVAYYSTQEYLIGKKLSELGIEFEKEVEYGNTNHVFDFYLPAYDAYIEYYGIATQEYKARIEEKQQAYTGRYVIEIFKHDNTVGKLITEVQRLQSSTDAPLAQ